MPYSAVATYSGDKGSDMLQQGGFEELGSDFFDQFLTFSPEDNETQVYSILPESTFLESSNSDDQSGDNSFGLTDDEGKLTYSNSWQGDGAASLHDSHQLYAEISGRAALSDSELLSLEGITLESPQIGARTQTSLPSSPTLRATNALRRKNRIVESFSMTLKKATGALDKSLHRSPIRKSGSAPKMLRASSSNKNISNTWEKEAAKFSFDFDDDFLAISPPDSAELPNMPDSTEEPAKKLLSGFTYKSSSEQELDELMGFDTPILTPELDATHSSKVSQQLPVDSMVYPITPQTQNAAPSWGQLPPSQNSRNLSSGSIYPTDFDAPVWWNSAAVPMAQPAPCTFHTNPQRASKNLAMQLQNDLAYNTNGMAFESLNMTSGLMIQMPNNGAQRSYSMGSPPMQRGYIQPHHQNSHRHLSSHARSRHPHPSSPTRKSRAVDSDSDSPSPEMLSFPVRKRKSPKTSKHSTPRTPSAGEVSFVNYTPSDSRKILTGVAPSGSSKTKARREKEALEKRRKLSQAAVRAVRAAGGDVESLVEQGLLV